MKTNWNLLKKLYEVYSPSHKEQRMNDFITKYLEALHAGITISSDRHGNLYAVKGEAESYPCIVAHTDQVQHGRSSDFRTMETRDLIMGYSRKSRAMQGPGCDDKNGIWVALECLRLYPVMKAAFFREEEVGCMGSAAADMEFFDDCRYVLQCDRRGNSDLITTAGGTELCSPEFVDLIQPELWGYHEEHGLCTDVMTLKDSGLKVCAVNISCGYYNPHTDEEFTVKSDLLKCLRFVRHIIETVTEVCPHNPLAEFETGDWDYAAEDDIYDYIYNHPYQTAEQVYDHVSAYYPGVSYAQVEDMMEEWSCLNEEPEEELCFTTDGGKRRYDDLSKWCF